MKKIIKPTLKNVTAKQLNKKHKQFLEDLENDLANLFEEFFLNYPYKNIYYIDGFRWAYNIKESEIRINNKWIFSQSYFLHKEWDLLPFSLKKKIKKFLSSINNDIFETLFGDNCAIVVRFKENPNVIEFEFRSIQ